MRRIWVTGATGYLGRELVRQAVSAGWEVDDARVEIRDPAAVAAHVGRARPEAVVHTAYRQDPPEAWSTNVDGAANVAHAARALRLVHLSTDVVFDGRLAGRAYLEDDALSPVTDYGRSKAEAEVRVGAVHPAALLVRTSLIYGGVEPSKHELAALDRSKTFYADEIRCPIRVGDLAAALLELVDADVSGPLHVAGADAVSRAEFAELVARRPVKQAPSPPGRPLNCALDSSSAQSMIRTRLRGVRTVLS